MKLSFAKITKTEKFRLFFKNLSKNMPSNFFIEGGGGEATGSTVAFSLYLKNITIRAILFYARVSRAIKINAQILGFRAAFMFLTLRKKIFNSNNVVNESDQPQLFKISNFIVYSAK